MADTNDTTPNNTKNNYEPIEKWDDLNCNTQILRGIYAYGFQVPSPIQQKAIKPMMDKRDILAQAQSGTGKTGCFTIGTLSNIDFQLNETQAIILSPTRELSLQILSVINSLANFIKGYKSQLLVGGSPSEIDAIELQENKPHIVVGCPGRVFDMLRRKKLSTKYLNLIVLDEADEMLSTGFKEQVYNIFEYMPKDIQVALFSATMPSELVTLTDKFMREPVKVLVKSEQLTLEGISLFYSALNNDDEKYECLKDLFGGASVSQCIIYCNSVRRVQDLYDAMIADNYPVCCIHSNMTREERTQSFNDFKTCKHRVLISSNVTARGIDVQQVSTVINFDFPRDYHTYLHRIGRSGRWGRKGLGINFITKHDIRHIKEVERYYQTQIDELPVNWTQIIS